MDVSGDLGEVCVRRAEGHTMWDIQSLCEHCAFGISGSCVTRVIKTPRNEEGTEFRASIFYHASLRSIAFSQFFVKLPPECTINCTISFIEWLKLKKKLEETKHMRDKICESIRAIESKKARESRQMRLALYFPVTNRRKNNTLHIFISYPAASTRWIA